MQFKEATSTAAPYALRITSYNKKAATQRLPLQITLEIVTLTRCTLAWERDCSSYYLKKIVFRFQRNRTESCRQIHQMLSQMWVLEELQPLLRFVLQTNENLTWTWRSPLMLSRNIWREKLTPN